MTAAPPATPRVEELRRAPPPSRPADWSGSPTVFRPGSISGPASAASRPPLIRRDVVGAFESRLRWSARWRWLGPTLGVAAVVLVLGGWWFLSRRGHATATRPEAAPAARVAEPAAPPPTVNPAGEPAKAPPAPLAAPGPSEAAAANGGNAAGHAPAPGAPAAGGAAAATEAGARAATAAAPGAGSRPAAPAPGAAGATDHPSSPAPPSPEQAAGEAPTEEPPPIPRPRPRPVQEPKPVEFGGGRERAP